MEQYLCVGGVEIINRCRDISLIIGGEHPAAPPKSCHPPEATCCWEDYTGPCAEMPPPPSCTPEGIEAPWYDPLVPDSADVLGIVVESMRLSSPWRREFQSNGYSSVASSGGYDTRELVVTGWFLTRSCCATEYARQWLFSALAQPQLCSATCELPSATIRTCDWRTLRGAGLVDFEWSTDPDFACCYGAKFSFTMQFEEPFLFAEPDMPIFDAELASGTEVCIMCEDFPCPENIDSSMATIQYTCDDCPITTVCCECGACNDCLNCLDCDPLQDAFAQNPVSDYCAPPSVFRSCATFIPKDWESATPVLTVNVGPELYPGGPGLRNLRLRAWPNPLGLDPGDRAFSCDPCIALEISCLPANSTFVFDGTTRQAYVVCGGVKQNAYKYLSSNSGPVVWPIVQCTPLMFCIESDSYNSGTSSATLEMFGVERG